MFKSKKKKSQNNKFAIFESVLNTQYCFNKSWYSRLGAIDTYDHDKFTFLDIDEKKIL